MKVDRLVDKPWHDRRKRGLKLARVAVQERYKFPSFSSRLHCFIGGTLSFEPLRPSLMRPETITQQNTVFR